MKKLILLFFLISLNLCNAQNFADSKGALEVSNSGQAVYTVPISVPPSIKDFAPIINLVYTSGKKGGIAGQGWDISTISSIMRMSTRRDIDGFSDGVDFDANDKLALDGQRLLLKSGIYWANGSTYQTEFKSNLKIELKVEGSAYGPQTYFIVTNVDGSKTWYGSTGNGVIQNATSLTAWYIIRSEDVYGNFITYNYTDVIYNGSTQKYIDNILFSGNEAQGIPQVNQILFHYVNSKRIEKDFIKGQASYASKILDMIEVKTGGALFRKYQLTRSVEDFTAYERVTQVQEFNGSGEPSNPIVFSYFETTEGINRTEKPYLTMLDFSSVELAGDFDGDGRLDFIANNMAYTNLFNDIIGNPPVSVPTGIRRMAVNTLDTAGRYNQFQSLLTINTFGDTQMKFEILNLQNSQFQSSYTKTIDLDLRVIKDPLSSNTGSTAGIQCAGYWGPTNYIVNPEPTNYIEGDFDGNGISEIIIYKPSRHFAANIGSYYPGGPFNWQDCPINITTVDEPEYRLLDLNPTASTGYSSAGYMPLTTTDIDIYSKHYIYDFNGDGRSDIIQFTGNAYNIVSIVKNNGHATTELIGEGIMWAYSPSKQILFGDYNGDGKVDIMLPDTEGGQNNAYWHIYYSNPNPNGGNFFLEEGHLITEYWPQHSGQTFQEMRNYYAMDVNKDGKSDVVVVVRKYSKANWTINDHDTHWSVTSFTNNLGVAAAGGSGFTPSNYWEYNISTPDIPLVVTANYRHSTTNSDLVIVRARNFKIEYYDFTKDFNSDNRLKSVSASNGNIIDQIDYYPMKSHLNPPLGGTYEFYSSTNSLFYPNIEIISNQQLQLVSLLTSNVNGVLKYKKFRYQGYMSNFNYGDLGFLQTARTNWYLSDSGPKVWTIQKADANYRGAIVNIWSTMLTGNQQLYLTPIQPVTAQSLSSTTNVYSSFVNPQSKEYNMLLLSQTTINFSEFTKIERTFTYDGPVDDVTANGYKTNEVAKYFNLNSAQPEGKEETLFDYYPNSTGTGPNYFIGRLKKTTLSQTVYNASGAIDDIRNSSEELFYNGVNIYKKEKKGHNTDARIETLSYDACGNIISKTSSMPTSVPSVAPRMVTDEYDPTKRFVIKKTSPEQFDTLYEYNELGQVKKSTDHLGVIVEFLFDNWGKVKKSTTSGASATDIVSTFDYAKSSDGSYTINKKCNKNNTSEITKFDVLDREITISTKGFASGTFISVKKEYDGLGRLLRESEPYFQSPTKWAKTYEYDFLDRPIKIFNAANRQQIISYNHNTTTLVDNGKVTTVTLNSMGNKVKTTDDGGIINFTYFANGTLKTSSFEGNIVSQHIDGWGNIDSTTDPNAGSYNYSYDGFGQRIKESNLKGYTEYSYDNVGKILTKKIVGDGADYNISNTYNAVGLLVQEISRTSSGAFIDSFDYIYDPFNRLSSTIEMTPNLEHTTTISFDPFGRAETETYTTQEKLSGNDFTSRVIYKNIYNSYNGSLYKITDQNNTLLWQINSTNEKMQTLNESLGNGVEITNTYTSDYYISSQKHTKNNVNLLHNGYTFDAIKGTLSSRDNFVMGIHEDFTYDNFERLETWSNPINLGVDYNTYDNKGRIILNNGIGQVNYNTNVNTGIYRKGDVKLNRKGMPYYGALGGSQIISYTMFNSPIAINESNKGKIDFEYSSHLNRSKMNYDYGLTPSSNTKVKRKAKLYTDDQSTEIIFDDLSNTIKIITYIGGDAYQSILYNEKTYNRSTGTTTEEKYYIHRDYLGSVLAISDSNGLAKEKRHFDAWGNLAKILDANNLQLDVANGFQVFDRGYTGHEHLTEVRLIQMNGRLYDPILRGFLMPDNFIQQPDNTQNYNRFSYVLNNPLSHSDPSGEYGLGIAVIVAVAIAVVSYTLTAVFADVPFSATGLLTSAVIGAATAVVTFGVCSGVGSLFTNTPIGFWAGATQYAIIGTAGGFTSYITNAALAGNAITLKGALGSAIIGGVTGGIVGGITCGLEAQSRGLAFWTGKGETTEYLYASANVSSNSQYLNNTEMRNDYNASIGNTDNMNLEFIENKLNTSVYLGQNGNLPTGCSVNASGDILTPDGTAAWGVTHSRFDGNIFHSPSSQISIAPNVKGLPLEIKNMVFKHEFMHAWHWNSGLANYDKFTERATSTYTYAYLKAYGYPTDAAFYLKDMGWYPKEYSWTKFNKSIPTWIRK